LLGVLACLLCTCAQAHKPSDSYLRLHIDGEHITGQWDIALRDLDLAIGLDGNADNAIDWGEVRTRASDIDGYALGHLSLSGDDSPCLLTVTDHLVDHHTDGTYIVLMLDGVCAAQIATLKVDYSLLFNIDAQHRGLLRLEYGAEETRVITTVLSEENARQHFAMSESSAWRRLVGFISDGMHHIAIGYDHILFLIVLLLPAVLERRDNRWVATTSFTHSLWKVAAIVTAFTIAHSITLTLATLGLVNLPSRLVESAIALSVVLTAIDNVFPFLPRRRWIVAFVFGLLHGFGFASVLSDLGLPRSELALSLLGFNIGVEIGQLLIVLLIVPLAFLLRDQVLYPRYVLRGGSALIGTLATAWLLERSFNLSFMPF
jgi:hypothetical protein